MVEQMPLRNLKTVGVWQQLFEISDGVLLSIAPLRTSVVIPDTVREIAANAAPFELESVTIPATVTVIHDGAFLRVGLMICDEGSAAHLYAQKNGIPCRINTYELRFDAAPGTPCAPISGALGSAISLETPILDGAVFEGWQTPEGTMFTGNTMPGRSMTLTAVWSYQPGFERPYTYIYNEDGTVTITGYTGMHDRLSIPDTINGRGVTAIEQYAFQNAEYLLYVTVPAGIERVGRMAFAGSAVRQITFEGADTVLGSECFRDCYALSSVHLPAALREVPAGLFAGCDILEQITLPNSVEAIGYNAFDGCSLLTSLCLPSGLQSFSADMLAGMPIRTISVAAGSKRFKTAQGMDLLTADGKTLLYVCTDAADTEYTVPAGVERIADRAMAGTSFRAIYLNDGLLAIGSRAMNPVYGLQSILVPDSVTTFGASPFPTSDRFAVYVSGPEAYAYEALRDEYTVLFNTGVAAESITLDAETLTLSQHSTHQLTATILPADTADTRITWVSSNDQVVLVDHNGLVTAQGVGSATVTAYLTETLYASCTVQVNKASVRLTDPRIMDAKDRVYVQPINGVFYLEAQRRYTFGLWDPESGMSQDEDCYVSFNPYFYDSSFTAPAYTADARYTLTWTDEAGQDHEEQLAIYPAIRTHDAEKITMSVGTTAKIDPVMDEGFLHLCSSWTSDDESVADVDGNGVVRAIAPGAAWIAHSTIAGVHRTLVEVTEDQSIPAVRAELEYPGLLVDHPVRVLMQGLTDDMTVNVAVSDSGVEVDGLSLICRDDDLTQAVTIEVTVIRQMKTLLRQTFTAHVYDPVTDMKDYLSCDRTLDDDTKIHSITPGSSFDMMEAVKTTYYSMHACLPETVLWASSDESVLSVDRKGLLKAHKDGRAVITCTLPFASNKVCRYEFVSAVWEVSGELYGVPRTMFPGESCTIIPMLPAHSGVTITYSSSNPDVVSVDEHGVLTALQRGYAYIEACFTNSLGYELTNGSADVNVQTLLLEPDRLFLPVGQTGRVDYTLAPGYSLSDVRCSRGYSVSLKDGYALVTNESAASSGSLYFYLDNGDYQSCNLYAQTMPMGRIKPHVEGPAVMLRGETRTITFETDPRSIDPNCEIEEWSTGWGNEGKLRIKGDQITALASGRYFISSVVRYNFGEESYDCDTEYLNFTLTVIDPPAGPVSMGAQTITLDADLRTQLHVYDANGAPVMAEAFVWTSSAPDTISVDAQGRVWGSRGTAQITAQTMDGKLSAAVTVILDKAVKPIPAELILPAALKTIET